MMRNIVLFALLCLLVSANGQIAFAGTTLRVLTWPGYADADVVRTFEQRHGVRVEVTLVSTDDALWEKIHRNQGADYDVFAANTAELQRYIAQDLALPLNLANIPNRRNQLPRFADLASIPGLVQRGATYAIPYTYSEMGLIYDRRQVQVAPTSIRDMWDARYRGRVLAYNGSTHNFTLAAMALGLPDPFRLDAAQTRRVAQHLVALRRNALAFYSSPEQAVEMFMQDGAAILFANFGAQQVTLLRQAGADIGYVIPREGALAWLDCWAVSRGARNRALAEAWINYTLEPRVSELLTQRQGLSNTLRSSSQATADGRLVWLQPVEDAGGRAALWQRILSGERPEGF